MLISDFGNQIFINFSVLNFKAPNTFKMRNFLAIEIVIGNLTHEDIEKLTIIPCGMLFFQSFTNTYLFMVFNQCSTICSSNSIGT
jgi:hypothetical protein